MNLKMVSPKDLCESEEFLRRDFEYVFSSRLLFSCSIRFPSDEWENFELNEITS